MSPRPRKVSDEAVFAATLRAMSRLGPAELTLAEIAAEAGVTAGALVQRFGSKRDLLLRLTELYAERTPAMFAELRASGRSPLGALRAYIDGFSQLAATPEALARNLAYLQNDLADPDFRRHLVAQARATRAALEELLADAVAAGELEPATDPVALARTVETVINGALVTWGFHQEGTAARWVWREVETVLRPFRRGGTPGRAVGRARGRRARRRK